MSEKKPHTVWLTDEVWNALCKIADYEGLSINDVLAKFTIGLERYDKQEQLETLRKQQEKKEEIRRTLKKLITVIPSWLSANAEVYYCSKCDRLELYASYSIAVRCCKVCSSELAFIGVLEDWL